MDIIDVIHEQEADDAFLLGEEFTDMKHDKWVKAQQEAQAMLDWARQSEEADWIRETARAYAVQMVTECEESEMGLPIPLSLLQIPICYEDRDEPVHTDKSPQCDDPDCPCHAEGYAQEAQDEYDENGTHPPDCRCPWCSSEE